MYRKAGNKVGGGIKFGALVATSAKLKFPTHVSYMCMVIPYQTAKFKSANILAIYSDFGLNCQI